MHPVSLAKVNTNAAYCSFGSKKVDNPTQFPQESKQMSNYLIAGLSGLAMLGIAGMNLKKGKADLKNTRKPLPQLVLGFKDLLEDVKNVGIKQISDVADNCKESNILGSGQNSVVYKFTNPIMKNWCIKVGQKSPLENNIAPAHFEEIADEFGGKNMGQEVAKVSANVRILRRIDGKPHSIQYWSSRRASRVPITKPEADSFLERVSSISKFPQESFDDYASKLKLLDDKGYKADSFNPNNLIIDYEHQQMHIIDAYKYKPDEHRNSSLDLFCPLVDYANYAEYFNLMSPKQRKAFQKATKEIEAKCIKASEKQGLSTSEEKFADFILDIDTREGMKNRYTKCYISMRRCMNEQ